MNRSDLRTRTLRKVGDSILTTQANEWLENILYEFESLGFWRALETTDSQATSNGVDFYTLPATYSKGLMVSSSEPRLLVQVAMAELEEMRKTLAESGWPRFFALFANKIYLHPKPVTSFLPTLNYFFYKQITVPTDDGTDLFVTTGIKKKFHKFIIDGMVSEGYEYIDDERQDSARQKWESRMILMMKDNEEFVTFRQAQKDKPTEAIKPTE